MQVGQALAGRYRLEHLLGRGGMGDVFQAWDTTLDRRVAIKVLHSVDPEARERFLREAKVVAGLQHPHIGSVFDLGQDSADLYIVQELLQGETLAGVIARGAVPVREGVTVLTQVAEALAYAHEAGVIHRDVKPGNVFVTADGSARLIDFGIASVAGAAAITAVGYPIGTPAYSAPEQIRSEPLDHRADVFAFGVLAYETLTGTRPFGGDDFIATMHAMLTAPPPAASSWPSECPPALVDLILACLERERERRPGSMAVVRSRLQEILHGLGGPMPLRTPITPGGAAPPPPQVSPNTEAPIPPQGHYDSGQGTRVGPVVLPGWAGPPTVMLGGAEPVLPSGTRVGKFTVHELVAHGQTGHLYKAYDPVRSRLVGLKVISRPSGPVVERLLRASRIWLELSHPHLQDILEVDPGDVSGMATVATELIEGVDLQRLMRQRDFELLEKVRLGIQLCDALDYMHGKGIVHREVTPRNIVVSEPPLRLTLLDSGLARAATPFSAVTVTQAGVAVGDLGYMPPEQATGRHDHRADIFGVGAVLYELLTGRTFGSEGAEAVRDSLLRNPTLPRHLATTLVTALDPDPAQRFQSARELGDALRALAPDERPPVKLSSTVVTLHGIRTHARWQRTFSEAASRADLHCRLDRWNFGYFSVFQFLMPWSRAAKVNWFRNTYHDEFGAQAISTLSNDRPSIVAHSFGTYILGNALLRYPYLRFNKVLLCGSILPPEFPWDVLIERGQVQAVRNEYGARDAWTRVAQWFVPGTGPSGLSGFMVKHERLEQERFDYSHSEYFERGHMEDRWLPFVKRRLRHITPQERAVVPPRRRLPVGAYLLYVSVLLVVVWAVWQWSR